VAAKRLAKDPRSQALANPEESIARSRQYEGFCTNNSRAEGGTQAAPVSRANEPSWRKGEVADLVDLADAVASLRGVGAFGGGEASRV